ncbi:hypothetical protein OPT61_g8736 [Boeremia exigua]|uniref:Uncharacterized protein n=1 Tax=Boeremia exigua TaxID=749465 RepID=A0ACC2HXC3_9PLEO|nr:hypothetical protein OPT61_g8736 [Boeremia exigua]
MVAHGDEMAGMDMDGMHMGDSTSSHSGMAMAFFTATNTPLYSEAWTPQNAGQYAGTCIFLIILAITLRGIFTAKSFLDMKALENAMKRRYVVVAGEKAVAEQSNDASSMTGILTTNGMQEDVRIVSAPVKLIQPWRFSVDLPRAALIMVATGVGYLLMLAVMTFNVGYFLSILAGTFIGELALGRFNQANMAIYSNSEEVQSPQIASNKTATAASGSLINEVIGLLSLPHIISAAFPPAIRMLSKSLVALALAPVAFAHFTLKYPESRGFDEDKESGFPCGGFDSVSSQRTDFPINGAPIQINLGHQQTNIAVYLAVGDNPGDGFSVVLHPQFVVSGFGDFCLGDVSIPSNLNVTEGTKATIQVITNAHSDGGLYQCSDVNLVNTALSQSDFSSNCKNGTGVSVTQENLSGNPNDTSSTQTTSGSASASGAAASPTASTTGGAAQAKAAPWVLGAVGVVGLAML